MFSIAMIEEGVHPGLASRNVSIIWSASFAKSAFEAAAEVDRTVRIEFGSLFRRMERWKAAKLSPDNVSMCSNMLEGLMSRTGSFAAA